MWINTPNARLAIGSQRGLRLDPAPGTLLRSVRGTLWVTIDNDARDIVLDPGESFVVDSDQPLFVMALGERATLDVCSERLAPESPRPERRSWLGGLWPRRLGGTVASASWRGAATA
ncbi:MAG TPA: DUF2917 domain-containing protein [Burkholderiaceae bacterium]